VLDAAMLWWVLALFYEKRGLSAVSSWLPWVMVKTYRPEMSEKISIKSDR
jgi:hypothetical protein